MIDPARSACSERCAEFGDPPCYDVVEDWRPCDECLLDCGCDPVEALDPRAVIAPLV